MALPRRNLTISFKRSVSSATGKPETLVVAVVPISSPSAPESQATYVGGIQQQEVILANDVDVVFELLPSDHPTLTERVIYRVGWRNKYLGREFKYDIVMPDQDINFDDLEDLGAVLGGETYLHQSDRGRQGGVAALDDAGHVVDAFGVRVTGDEAANAVAAALAEEVVARQLADADVRSDLENALAVQINSVQETTANNLALAVSNLNHAINIERGLRTDQVEALEVDLEALQIALNNAVALLNEELAGQSAALLLKADLDGGGKLQVSQLPDIAICKAVTAANQSVMLSLTNVQRGDMAVRPDGVWQLQADDPSVLGNWRNIVPVMSVNSKTGQVVLTAADVGARSASDLVPLNEVDGLTVALANKADNAMLVELAGRVSGIESDTTIVRLNEHGEIDSGLLGGEVAYIDEHNQIVKKDGTVIIVEGGGVITSVNGKQGVVTLTAEDVGARPAAQDITISDVTDLSAQLSDKVENSDPRLSDAREPLSHAETHASGGTDPITIATSQVTGLNTILTNNGLTSVSNHESRIAALELGGGGGGGGGDIAKAAWFDGTTAFEEEDPGDFQVEDNVLLKGPFSVDDDGVFTYSPTGVAPVGNRYVFPHITRNGHLELREWNESNPPDPEYALESDLSDLSLEVASKANASDLADKADASVVNDLVLDVANKADASDLSDLALVVDGKANQSDLEDVADALNDKADASAVLLLSNTVSSHTTALGTKADLVGGKLKSDQIPTDIPQANVTGLSDALNAKADLQSGKVPLTQIPTNIPQSSISGLASSLAGKADLVGGKLATSQLPDLAITNTHVVANRAAMLSLTTSQVQQGDVCIITATSDQGNYILTNNDPSQFANWAKLQGGVGAVSSVNGQTGVVVLSAADVGARSAASPISQADVTGLSAALAAKADASTVTAELATKTTTNDVRGILTGSTLIKQAVNYVATSSVVSLSGAQAINGESTPMTPGSTVLLTAQNSSVQNGIYTVQSGAWTRVSDMASGSYFVRGTLVLVSNGSPQNGTNAATIWQETATSGTVDVNLNNWTRVGYIAPQYSPSAGNGIQITGSTFSVVPNTGITVTSSGVGIDTALVARKYAQDVPAGSTTATITHNLNNLDVICQVRDKASGDLVDVAYTVLTANSISLEFAAAPAIGQWRVVVMG